MQRARSASASQSSGSASGDELGTTEDAPVDILPSETQLAEGEEDTLPNTLVITVLQARHLEPSSMHNTLSCYVKLASLGRERKTSVMTKTLEPRWHETFVFRAVDWTTGVTVSVRDRLSLKMRFMGQVIISATDVASLPGMSCQRWFQLRGKGPAGATTGGELELKVALVYTRANNPRVFGSDTAAIELEHGSGGIRAGAVGFVVDQEDETEEEAIARAKAARHRKEQELEAATTIASLRQGDYQIQVHIIEARDLKGENLSGTSDPYCLVKIMGVKRKTSIKYNTLGCVFDEILFFNFPDIGQHELREASIEIAVYDKETILSDNLIGVYQFDCLSIYAQPYHELYRQWVAVHDHLSKKDRGIQGFLLVSVMVLGPGDALRVHDREAEVERELSDAAENVEAAGTGASPLVLMPPAIELKLQFLVVKVLRGEHLPAIDSGALLLGARGIDAIVQVDFATNTKCQSSCVTVKGRGNLAPDFFEELWLPVRTPTLSRHIAISLWDRDLPFSNELIPVFSNELVGMTSLDFHQIPASSGSPHHASHETGEKHGPGVFDVMFGDSDHDEDGGTNVVEEADADTSKEKSRLEEEQEQERLATLPRWLNLYGPPLRSVNKKRAQLVTRHSELGSTYRGRILVSTVRVEDPRAEDGEKFHVRRMNPDTPNQDELEEPKTIQYVLRGALFSGVELPRGSTSSSFARMGGAPQVRVTLSIGPHSLVFESQDVAKDGTATWEECLEPKAPLQFPADLSQVPDVIVTLSRWVGAAAAATGQTDEFVSISFARFRAVDLFERGFTAKCQWVVLREEMTRRQTLFALERSQSPGALLLRLGFGRAEVAARHRWVAEDDLDGDKIFAPFRQPRVHREIRVYVFQARGLEAAAGVARLPSPVVRVRCCGQQKRTLAHRSTSAPLFYEPLVFMTSVPASDVAFTPDIVLQVLDASSNTSGAEGIIGVIGELRLPLSAAVRSVASAGAPKPQWRDLKKPRSSAWASIRLMLAEVSEGRVSAGQILVAVQYIDHTAVTPTAVLRQPASIRPKMADATLSIVVLGVRHLKPLSALGVRRPYIEFELIGGCFPDNSSIRRTQPSISAAADSGSSGSSKDANFLEYIDALVKLPVDPLFAPQLLIRVCDSALGGLRKTTIATCIVDLATKLPWAPNHDSDTLESTTSTFENPQRQIVFKQEEAGGDQKPDKKRKKRQRGSDSSGAAAKQKVDPLKEEDDLEEGMEESQAEAETASDSDDGIGVGDLQLPSVLHSHSRLGSWTPNDPAVVDQQRCEQQRRYHAGKSALLLSHGQSSINANGSRAATATSMGSPTNSKEQEQNRPSYMRGRDWWITQHSGEELERYFSRPAFETYTLRRPVLSRPSLQQPQRTRVQVPAGIFKGRISISEHFDGEGSQSATKKREIEARRREHLELRKMKRTPQPVVVRVYVLRGRNLQAKDANGFSDPYLRLQLGNTRISDRANGCTKTLHPDFFRHFELETTLPGACQLDISVWDRDLVFDKIIGTTTIDLEERWFHREWQQLGQGHTPSRDEKEEGANLKPIEYRHLYISQGRSTSQGFLQLWVDILTPQEAARIEPVDISPPAPKNFEVRVIVWRAENVQDREQSEVNDYFVKAWMEGSDKRAESTDTHWRCSNGKPCWNWRLKMSTQFPPRSPEMARLHLQLWDKDIIKWNDVLGEAQLDLYKWLRTAYDTNRSVAPFLELKRLARQPADPSKKAGAFNECDEPEGDVSSDSGSEEDTSNDAGDSNATGRLSPRESASLLHKTSRKRGARGSRKQNSRTQELKAAERAQAKKQKEQAEAKAALNGLLDFVGLGQLPDDAEWIPVYFTDREAAVSISMGRLGVSVQILPEEEAQASPVGKGQSAPNMNPYLPPPVGRMRLSANPLAMLRELVGPKMCMRITLLCCCGCCIAFIAVFGATFMSTLTYIEMMRSGQGSSRANLNSLGGGVGLELNVSDPAGFQFPSGSDS